MNIHLATFSPEVLAALCRLLNVEQHAIRKIVCAAAGVVSPLWLTFRIITDDKFERALFHRFHVEWRNVRDGKSWGGNTLSPDPDSP